MSSTSKWPEMRRIALGFAARFEAKFLRHPTKPALFGCEGCNIGIGPGNILSLETYRILTDLDQVCLN